MLCKPLIPTIMVATLLSLMSPGDQCWAEPLRPHAPADMSWIPHGYGNPMYVETSLTTVQKGVYGFRDTPTHTAAWSQPMWGWDVNGFYAGPNVPSPDPGELQLPIGLIYPVNGPKLPPRPRVARPTKVQPHTPYHRPGAQRPIPYPQAPAQGTYYAPQMGGTQPHGGGIPVVLPSGEPTNFPAPPVQYPTAGAMPGIPVQGYAPQIMAPQQGGMIMPHPPSHAASAVPMPEISYAPQVMHPQPGPHAGSAAAFPPHVASAASAY